MGILRWEKRIGCSDGPPGESAAAALIIGERKSTALIGCCQVPYHLFIKEVGWRLRSRWKQYLIRRQRCHASAGATFRMDESIASGCGRGRNKRFWSVEEDKALITALCELASDPHWKCENGFRNGYMIRLEELINKAIPNCGLKASPHIDSRLKTLVGKFRAILQMLGTSGFKWDDERHMISVERSVYDDYCKAHPNCKNLYGVPFPYLNDMMSIYGKDYATGKPAEGFVDAVANMEKEPSTQFTIDSSDDDVDASGSSAPPLKKLKGEKSSKKRGVKKMGDTASGSSGSELATLQNFMDNMNVHLSTMANVMKSADDREQEIVEKSNQVLDELLSLDGITPNEALEAANILTGQPNKLMIFFKCPSALKAQYVKGILRGSGDGNA